MKNKLLTLGLTLLLAMGLSTVVGATDDGVIDTQEELEAALAEGGTVTLGDDIDLTSDLTITTDVVLDLGTHTLTLTSGGTVATVYINGDDIEVTIKNGTVDNNDQTVKTIYAYNAKSVLLCV